MAKAQPTSIRLEQDLYERVAKEAKAEKRSFSAQIEYMIEKYYEIRELYKN